MTDTATAPDLTTAATSPEQARAMMNTLRDQRMAGKVTERDFAARADFLGRIAEGEQNVTQAPAYETPDAQFERSFDEAMSPPRSPLDYRFENVGTGPVALEDVQRDRSIRESMHAAGVPAAYSAYMSETVAKLSARFANASSKDITAHVETVASTLRGKWGEQFKGKIDAIDELVAGVGGELGEMLAAAPWLLADPLVMQQLDSMIQHRGRKRA